MNNTERQREVHHMLLLIFSFPCRHPDSVEREERFLDEDMLQHRSDRQISPVSDGERRILLDIVTSDQVVLLSLSLYDAVVV